MFKQIRRQFPVVLTMAVLSQSCLAATYVLTPNPTPEQRVSDGAIFSMKSVGVAVQPQKLRFSRSQVPNFNVKVINKSDQPFDFSAAEITAKTSRKKVRVLGQEALAKKAKRGAMFKNLFTVAVGAAAVYSEAKNMTSKDVYMTRGTQHLGLMNKAIAETGQKKDWALTQYETMLKKQNVLPDSSHGGYIQLKGVKGNKRKPVPLVLTIKTGEEVHEFHFTIERAE